MADWSQEDLDALHDRCEASAMGQGVDQASSHALCNCTVPQLTSIFPRSWFGNGQPLTAEEMQTVSGVYKNCAETLSPHSL